MSKLEQRREKCRKNQARYRQRKHEYELKDQDDIVNLRAQVATLQKHQHDVLQGGTLRRWSVWSVAVEYFNHFKHGHATTHNGPCNPSGPSMQLDFLRATMTPDVTDGNVHGIDAIMEQWRLYTLYHTDLHMALERLERGPDNSVIATTKTSMTITESTLFHAFRHLLDGNCSHSDSIVSKLLGQRIVMRGSVQFGWDEQSGRVCRLTCSADMLTPMLKLLGSLEDVAFVFSRARITPDDNVVRLHRTQKAAVGTL
ncbi:bZIP transcription factor 1 [Phytophthora cinnamomi]|uniref:bZIP transcription factor 1 n=1 Tax=Phytophthora cinnamomi TaxID=4785 RepID=UPI00355A18CA|nr:bZIP transcription factor 1 [Phytophthora cinnamomi]